MKQVFTSLVCVIVVCLSSPAFGKNQNVTVGSKSFTESVVLGELVSHLARSADGSAIHRQAMGGTRVLWNALNNGDIDIYPEYTGTITQEILSGQKITGMKDIRQAIAAHGLRMSRPLGFNNTYAIGMKEPRANELGITTVSDLRTHPDLRFGFSNEFMDRGDGWPSLRNTYALPQQHVNGLEHDLAYRGLESGSIDAIDLYMTDADIQYYQLRVLEDDLS
ncbi:MAG TPA: amino acid ABC transporter permease, partial [Nitrospirales bacterium]|nr:amino acid ABC transporter permease [Nitrospirales bacterium]